jgi:RNA polymerase sigma factor (sigma-70 family)
MPTDWRSAFARVKGALLRRGRTEHDADDLLQEAWVRLASYARERPVEKPEAFLMQVALNLSIDSHRMRQTRGEEVLLEDVVLVDVTPSAEAVLLARERTARLSVCLGRLTDKTRDILLAHRIESLTYAEIAQRHNLSVSTVERHVAKAMLQLTTWMEGW